MKFIIVFLLLLLTSCVSTINKSAFRKKLINRTEVQVVKSVHYNNNFIDDKMSINVDSIMKNVFQNKNIELVNSKSKYVLFIDKMNYEIVKESAEVQDSKGLGTRQYGTQLIIKLDFEAKIIDTLTKNEKKTKWNFSDIKPVHSDFLFDFFAVDSNDSFSPLTPLNNCFNAMSHKTVNFINKQN